MKYVQTLLVIAFILTFIATGWFYFGQQPPENVYINEPPSHMQQYPSTITIHINTSHILKNNLTTPISIESLTDEHVLVGLISIGCVHTSTSTIRTLMCNLDKNIICPKRNEFSYFHVKTHAKQWKQLITDYPSDNLLNSTYELLSNWVIDIDTFNEYGFTHDSWLKNWPYALRLYFERNNNYILYGKYTSHYKIPQTAMIFANMAYTKKWKYFIQLREPINRLWSVQQHWHTYNGTGFDIRHSAVDYIWEKYNINKPLVTLVNAISNYTLSNDYLIGLYYYYYIQTQRKHHSFEAYEFTGSLYCVFIMFWLKQFELRFGHQNIDKIYDHFRIIQFEYIKKDFSNAKYLIYCWMTQNVDNMKECSLDLITREDVRIQQNKVPEAGKHRWSFEMAWKDRKKLMEMFIPCNNRLDAIINKRKHIILGEWKSYNVLYEEEKQLKHNDSIIIDHPERNKNKSRKHKRYKRTEKGPSEQKLPHNFNSRQNQFLKKLSPQL